MTLKEALESFAEENKKPRGDYDSEASTRTQSTGMSLLFLAHLRRQGRPEVDALFEKALAAAPAQEALDVAVSAVAEARLAELNERWVRAGDAKAYAAGLEALAAQFHRGWTNRGGALLLAGRLRGDASAPAHTPAAELLRGLRQADLEKVPLEANWILPESEAADGEIQMMRRLRGRYGAVRGLVSPKRGKDGAGSPVEAFFQQRVKAAGELVPLLGSHEILRLLRDTGAVVRYRSRTFDIGNSSPEEGARASYGEMPRPYELGELVIQLLQAIMPGRESNPFGNNEGERARRADRVGEISRGEKR